MAKARALDKRRKSIRNIRKITRTMELIATARFKKAMDRAAAATAYTRADHGPGGRPGPQRAWKSAIRCWSLDREIQPGGAAGADRQPRPVRRLQLQRAAAGPAPLARTARPGAGDRAGSFRQARHLGLPLPRHRADRRRFTQFEDKPQLRRGRVLANRYLEDLPDRPARSAGRGLHAVREHQPAVCRGRDALAAGRAA